MARLFVASLAALALAACASSPDGGAPASQSVDLVCAQPPGPEQLALAKSLTPDAVQPAGSAGRGSLVFATECERCHGASAPADRGYPKLSCAPYLAAATDDYLRAIVSHGGKPFGKRSIMRAYGKRLGPEAVSDLVAYLRAQARR